MQFIRGEVTKPEESLKKPMVLTWVSEPCRMAAVTAVSGNVFMTLWDERHDQSAGRITGYRSQHMIVGSQGTRDRIGDGRQAVVSRHSPAKSNPFL